MDVSDPSRATLRGLDLLNVFLADIQTGVGPFLAIYLASHAWNEQQIGLALTVGGVAGIVCQTPTGWLVDGLRAKRGLIGAAIVLLAIAALMIALAPSTGPVLVAQIMIGVASCVFVPAICAVSLGAVGPDRFDARQGRNQALNSAGNVASALVMGWIGYAISERAVFFTVVALAVPTLGALATIRARDIDFDAARGCPAETTADRSSRGGLGGFLIACALFHLSNAAMLPLLGEMLAKGRGSSSMLFMSACVIITQLVISLTANRWAAGARRWGQRRLLLVAFAVLPVRAVLYTLTDAVPLLLAIQILDGIAAGIFGVVSVLVIAERTRGTGRFNLALGAMTTAVGVGAATSQITAGAIAHHLGTNASFLFLSAVGVAAVIASMLSVHDAGGPALAPAKRHA